MANGERQRCRCLFFPLSSCKYAYRLSTSSSGHCLYPPTMRCGLAIQPSLLFVIDAATGALICRRVCKHCLHRAPEVSIGLPRRHIIPLHRCDLRDGFVVGHRLPCSVPNNQRTSRATQGVVKVLARRTQQSSRDSNPRVYFLP